MREDGELPPDDPSDMESKLRAKLIKTMKAQKKLPPAAETAEVKKVKSKKSKKKDKKKKDNDGDGGEKKSSKKKKSKKDKDGKKSSKSKRKSRADPDEEFDDRMREMELVIRKCEEFLESEFLSVWTEHSNCFDCICFDFGLYVKCKILCTFPPNHFFAFHRN